jgi:hypothetical protein
MFTWEWGAKHLQGTMVQSLWLMVILGVLYLGFRLVGRWFPQARLAGAQSFTREFAVVLALRALWQYVGHRVRTHSDAAVHRAEQVQALQSWLHLPDELTIQQLVLPHPWFVQVLNAYYATVHLDGMILFLVWVWWKRRAWFRTVRNTLVAVTLICLLIQSVPVAPPRLLPAAGFVDTALQYGQSVYGPYQAGLAAQLTAMPSLHIGWAFIVAWYAFGLGRGPLRWIGVADLIVTFFVIVATANHWWLDGVAAIAVVLGVLSVQVLLRRAWETRGRPSTPAPRPRHVVVPADAAGR